MGFLDRIEGSTQIRKSFFLRSFYVLEIRLRRNRYVVLEEILLLDFWTTGGTSVLRFTVLFILCIIREW